jgi:hypothetical protein
MDFLDALKLLWRRRLIVALGMLLTGLGCAGVILHVQTVYQASAQYLLLLPSQATGLQNPQNPLIDQPPGLVIGASLIAADINTQDSLRLLAKRGFTSDFAVALAPQSGPLLTVQVTDTDPVAAIAERDELLRRLDIELARLQTRQIPGVPQNQIITSLKAAVNHEPEAVPGAKIKALVAVIGVGALCTLLLAFGLDGPLTRRTTRRRGERSARDEDEPRDDDWSDGTGRDTGDLAPREPPFEGENKHRARFEQQDRPEHPPGGRDSDAAVPVAGSGGRA